MIFISKNNNGHRPFYRSVWKNLIQCAEETNFLPALNSRILVLIDFDDQKLISIILLAMRAIIKKKSTIVLVQPIYFRILKINELKEKSPSSSSPFSRTFETHCDAHSSTDAQRCKTFFRVTALHFKQKSV